MPSNYGADRCGVRPGATVPEVGPVVTTRRRRSCEPGGSRWKRDLATARRSLKKSGRTYRPRAVVRAVRRRSVATCGTITQDGRWSLPPSCATG